MQAVTLFRPLPYLHRAAAQSTMASTIRSGMLEAKSCSPPGILVSVLSSLGLSARSWV